MIADSVTLAPEPRTGPADSSIPTYDGDLFSPEALRAPFDHYRRIRDLAPVVQLREPPVYMLSRFADVKAALRASDILISGEGVGFSDEFNRTGAPNIIQSDGDLHKRLKVQIMKPLLPQQLQQHRDLLKSMISARVEQLVDRGPFDAMEEIARFLPVAAISELVGLPEKGRSAMLDWAAATFNAIGPRRDEFDSDYLLLGQARAYLAGLNRADVREGSWARTLFDAAEAGRLSEAEARGALSAYVLPSLDTTILAKGHLLRNLALHPDQWRRVREDPSLVPSAVIEAVRHSSVIRWFSRIARDEYPVGATTIPRGARVMLMYASANRDERRFEEPDRFLVDRDARDQLAWGAGAHVCAGMHLAKLEMEVMLEALVERCVVIEAGEPEVIANRGLHGFKSLPMELRSA